MSRMKCDDTDWPICLVLGSGNNALGTVRSLVWEGVRTLVISNVRNNIASLSRYPKECYFIEGSTNEEIATRKLNCILNNVPRGSVILPTSDIDLVFLLENQDILKNLYQLCIPNNQLLACLIDKQKECKYFSDLILLPKTMTKLSCVDGYYIVREIGLPLILKPACSQEQHLFDENKNWVINTIDELNSVLSKYSNCLDRMIAQEYIPCEVSELWNANCVFDRSSNLVQCFTFRCDWTSPAYRGSTTYGVSLINTTLRDIIEDLGNKVGYVGPAVFEFLYDKRDQKYKYIEINPRIGLSNVFGTYCGINTAFCAYCIAADIPIELRPAQRVNIIYMFLLGDLHSKRDAGMTLTSIMKIYIKDIHRKHVGPVLSWSDPYPAISSLWNESISYLKNRFFLF